MLYKPLFARAPNGTQDWQCIFRGGAKILTFGADWGPKPVPIFRGGAENLPFRGRALGQTEIPDYRGGFMPQTHFRGGFEPLGTA